MQVLFYVLCYLAGVASAVVALLIFAWYLGMQERLRRAEIVRKEAEATVQAVEQQTEAEQLEKNLLELIKQRQTNTPQMPTDPGVASSVKERLRKAVELTSKQSKIDTKKGPDFIMQHNELELEKLSVLKTILADGFDPVITIRYNTGEQEMLLSTYVKSITKGLA